MPVLYELLKVLGAGDNKLFLTTSVQKWSPARAYTLPLQTARDCLLPRL